MKSCLFVRQHVTSENRRFSKFKAGALLAAAALLSTVHPSVFSFDGQTDIARVEEDWELVLDAPSGAKVVPQFMTVMSPYNNLQDLYGMVTWNYREMPNFSAGGMQLQSWADDLFLYSKNFRESEFSTTGETITWTQSLKINGNYVTLQVKNGESLTWGSFGGTQMQLSEQALVSNLNGYSPETTVSNSGITYGANRVVKLRIKAVRYYDALGNLLSTDNTSHVVHERPSDSN
jgi:hypothetical protein